MSTASRTFTVQARVGAARRAATRERILGAARRMLERGDSVAALTVARLAEEAEVSRATFYLHFPDKRNLVEALFEQTARDWDDISEEALADPEISRERLREVLRAGVDNGIKHSAIVSGIVELGEYDGEVREAWHQYQKDGAANHTGWIRRLRPDLSERQLTVLGEVLSWTGERSIQRMTGVRGTPSATPDELADALTEIWWCVTHPTA